MTDHKEPALEIPNEHVPVEFDEHDLGKRIEYLERRNEILEAAQEHRDEIFSGMIDVMDQVRKQLSMERGARLVAEAELEHLKKQKLVVKGKVIL